MKSLFSRLLFAFVSLSIPFFLLMSAIRILLIPSWYPQIEYHLSNFPADPYGFTTADRMKWSQLSIEYLVNDAPLTFLSDLRLDAQTPLYNERELSHMQDVKNVVQGMIIAWRALVVMLLLVAVGVLIYKRLPEFLAALSTGGWLTIGLLVLILFFVAVSFDQLFIVFHSLFFKGDSWLFNYSDSLIRLFPEKFWIDAFIWVGGISIGFGALLGLGGRWLAKRI